MEIKVNAPVTPEQIAAVYHAVSFDKAIEDKRRLQTMLTETPLMISAWEGEQLIGFVRCLTDFDYFCYVSESIVLPEWQRQKIGSNLLTALQDYLGNRVMIAWRSEKSARHFYQKNGYEATPAMYRIHREG